MHFIIRNVFRNNTFDNTIKGYPLQDDNCLRCII